MATHRATIVIAAVISGALLASCSDDPATTPETAPQSAPETGQFAPPSASASVPPSVVTWADGVCTASTQLETSLRAATSSLQIQPGAAGTAIDQAKAQASERGAAVKQDAAGLRTAIAAVPAEAGESVAAARQELGTASDRASTAVDQLSAKAQQLSAAQTRAETVSAVASLGAALAATATGVAGYLDALRQTTASRDPVVRDAFATAPACVARNVSAPVSS
jgi:hypothetical protein